MKSVELFDALDQDGKPTEEKKTKQQIFDDGDWRNVVHVWVVNAPGRLIIQKRAFKGLWDDLWDISVGGGLSAGEDPANAAARELHEELGVAVEPSELVKIARLEITKILPEQGITAREFSDTFLLVKPVELSSLKLSPREVAEVKEMTFDELKKEISDDKKYQKWMPHPKEYYLGVISAIEKMDIRWPN